MHYCIKVLSHASIICQGPDQLIAQHIPTVQPETAGATRCLRIVAGHQQFLRWTAHLALHRWRHPATLSPSGADLVIGVSSAPTVEGRSKAMTAGCGSKCSKQSGGNHGKKIRKECPCLCAHVSQMKFAIDPYPSVRQRDFCLYHHFRFSSLCLHTFTPSVEWLHDPQTSTEFQE